MTLSKETCHCYSISDCYSNRFYLYRLKSIKSTVFGRTRYCEIFLGRGKFGLSILASLEDLLWFGDRILETLTSDSISEITKSSLRKTRNFSIPSYSFQSILLFVPTLSYSYIERYTHYNYCFSLLLLANIISNGNKVFSILAHFYRFV